MNIGLFDLDIIKQRRPFPNLALMKLSAYHKKRGDTVIFNFPLAGTDVNFGSCVFTWNASLANGLMAEFGGSGINLTGTLPDVIEHTMPDYSLYNANFSMGFTSRGCPRKCPWCLVPAKEGNIRAWADPREFWNPTHKKLILLDNNLLASPTCRETLNILTRLPVIVDFNQGLDIRLLDDEKIVLLKSIRTETLRFAFDSLGIERAIRDGIGALIKAGFRKSVSF